MGRRKRRQERKGIRKKGRGGRRRKRILAVGFLIAIGALFAAFNDSPSDNSNLKGLFVVLAGTSIVIIISFFLKKLTAFWVRVAVIPPIIVSFYFTGIILSYIQKFSLSETFLMASTLFIMVLILNINVILIYWFDKHVALSESSRFSRVPENAFHVLTCMGGAIGAYIGQKVFHHKTVKQSFRKTHSYSIVISIVLYLYIANYFFK